MCLEGKCEVAVEKEVFNKVCSWKLLSMEDTFPVRGTELFTGRYDVALYFAACEERLVEV